MKEKDIREVLPRGRNGQGIIDGATVVTDPNHDRPCYIIKITISGKKYVAAKCILQTKDWDPKKGDLVKFDRQPDTVSDEYLFATRLEA